MAVRSVMGTLAAGGLAMGLLATSPAEAYTVKSTDSGATVRWHTNAVTLRIDDSMQRYFDTLPVKDLTNEASEAWLNLPGVPELLINDGQPGPRGFDPDSGATNGIYLVEDWQLADSSLAVTVATFESKSGKIVDTDILVNPNHPFGLMPNGPDRRATTFDLRGVLTHEFGHVLGLGESYDVRMATMWPNIARGETHQRDISEDDEDGVELAYAAGPIADVESPNGCGGSSVVLHRQRRTGAGFWFLSGGLLIGAGLWLRSRARRGRSKSVPALALVLLFGAPGLGSTGASENERVEVLKVLSLRNAAASVRHEKLLAHTQSKSRQVRMAAAALLERVGTQEDQSLAARLAQDSDTDVARMGRSALEALRTAPPAARVAPTDEGAQARLAVLFEGAQKIVAGEAVASNAEMKDGLIWSRYLVHAEDQVVDVKIAGGSLGGITQVVSEQEPPSDGEHIVVAVRANGKSSWAHMRDGVIYGGHLGDGPAIQWTP